MRDVSGLVRGNNGSTKELKKIAEDLSEKATDYEKQGEYAGETEDVSNLA